MGTNVVPVLAAAVSVTGAVVTVLLGAILERRRSRTQRRVRLRHVASRYSVPLLQAAHSLRARLGNTVAEQISEFREGPDRFGDYARYESLYRLARYLCIVQIMWREVDFLDFGRRRHNRELIKRLVAVGGALSDRTTGRLLVLGGEQRALGDLMIDPDGPPRCLTYPQFRDRMRDERFAAWFQPLLDDIDAVVGGEPVPARHAHVVKALGELTEFLDRRRIGMPWGDEAAG
ncbi:hypothetical protein SAMN04488074_107338 [Lentzea albidocapillata subsp. violacea]|uniref:Uncharacterized protein n=1 Tax=Lentzea albidocapillata subsp. violacea TaxID=128104 RepID=A0A1G9FEZ0_9PSEU|nr:hypothetical protein [Lentzea albidocapillata]SDK86948.1 hypothetical protein SAMN04488074_107338 [Lentzea albidocapillata subsp. violacea]